MSELTKADLNVLIYEVGVNMGDHAETVIRAHVVDPSETVGDMVTRLLHKPGYIPYGETVRKLEPQSDWKLEVRIAIAEGTESE